MFIFGLQNLQITFVFSVVCKILLFHVNFETSVKSLRPSLSPRYPKAINNFLQMGIKRRVLFSLLPFIPFFIKFLSFPLIYFCYLFRISFSLLLFVSVSTTQSYIANFRGHGKIDIGQLTWTFLYRIKKGLFRKTVITSSIFRIENYLKWSENI